LGGPTIIHSEGDNLVEYFVAYPQEKKIDKEYFHASIENEDTPHDSFEGQKYEENFGQDLDGKRIQASSTSSLHERKDLRLYTIFQDFKFYDTSFSNLEK